MKGMNASRQIKNSQAGFLMLFVPSYTKYKCGVKQDLSKTIFCLLYLFFSVMLPGEI